MTILIKKTNAKPKQTLAQQTTNFQFKKPEVKAKPSVTSLPIVEDKPKPKAQPAPSTAIADLVDEVEQEVTKKTAIGFKKPASPIPELADDKYQITIGSEPEFSESAGNKFTEQLDMLQQAIDGTGDLKDQMVNILTFLDDNPQYKENVGPKDVAVFVAACRKVAGITVQEKTTRKTRQTKAAALEQDIMDDLADLNFDL